MLFNVDRELRGGVLGKPVELIASFLLLLIDKMEGEELFLFNECMLFIVQYDLSNMTCGVMIAD